MKLADLDPKLNGTVADGSLRFDCPFPACERKHRIVVPISASPYHEREIPTSDGKTYKQKVWQASGAFPDSLSLTPSIDIVELNAAGEKVRTICWHGHITEGEIR